mmetsp:Transcript_1025/g.1789  ORF Transcript_1025/g.1789 Transcript_1025/m.1789 type:complete len:98 (+) Transcript_1025:418-711(+)
MSSAYENRNLSYDELLETCCAIEEELVFASAPSRLDYFKTGMQFDKRVAEKRKQLTEGPMGGNNDQSMLFSPGKPVKVEASTGGDVSDSLPSKRQKN